jgi:hypothetical protein
LIYTNPDLRYSLWNVQEAIDTINQTYEIDETIGAWNYRSHYLLTELKDQISLFSCSGGVWTQTTDVEGEVNGLLTYDRRVLRPNETQWKADIQALYDAAASRSNSSIALSRDYGMVGATESEGLWGRGGPYVEFH